MNNVQNLGIAWLLPSAFFYWQPTISEFSRLFPRTIVYTGRWHGFAEGFEDKLTIEVVGDRKVIPLKRIDTGYDYTFTYLSPSIIGRLLRFKPQIIFSSSFGVWTILALFLKAIGRWQVVIAYEGSSPGVDYRSSNLRIAIRQLMVKFADACITNSHAGKSYLIQILKAKESCVFVQPYEVPALKSLSGHSPEIEQSINQFTRPVFLFVGSLNRRKGLSLLLEACARLSSQGKQNYTLLVVGDGSQRPEFEAFCEEHHLSNCVQLVGRVDYKNLGTYFRCADVFVLPTLEDTWGVVVLEAMLLGKPVICSQWAGAAEIIHEGENGFIVDPHNSEIVAEKMQHFIDHPELITQMGKKSSQLMSQYSPEAAAQFLAQVSSFVLKH